MSDYKVKPNEQGYIHVRFTKIMKGKGKRTYDVHKNQIFSVKEFETHKRCWEKYGFAGITQQDEYVVLHDPRISDQSTNDESEKERNASNSSSLIIAKEKANNKGKTNEGKESDKNEVDAIKKYLTDNDVKFHAKLGLKKLKELKQKTENELNT